MILDVRNELRPVRGSLRGSQEIFTRILVGNVDDL